MASVLSLSGCLKHLLRMEVHLWSFRSSVLGSTASVFLDHVWGRPRPPSSSTVPFKTSEGTPLKGNPSRPPLNGTFKGALKGRGEREGGREGRRGLKEGRGEREREGEGWGGGGMEIVPPTNSGTFHKPKYEMSVDFSRTATKSRSSQHVSMRDANCKVSKVF